MVDISSRFNQQFDNFQLCVVHEYSYTTQYTINGYQGSNTCVYTQKSPLGYLGEPTLKPTINPPPNFSPILVYRSTSNDKV